MDAEAFELAVQVVTVGTVQGILLAAVVLGLAWFLRDCIWSFVDWIAARRAAARAEATTLAPARAEDLT